MKHKLNAIIENMRNQHPREPVIVQAMRKQEMFDEIAAGRKAIKRARRIALVSVLGCLGCLAAAAVLSLRVANAGETGAVSGCITTKSELIAEGKPLPKVVRLIPETKKR